MTRNRGDAESTDGYANTAAASLVRAKDGSGFIKWKRREKWLHLHLAKIKVGVQLLVSPWKISNICSWSRTTPLIHSPCF
ncbi:hypothetical protein BDE02_18G126400 [Populus trichocarpa]|nr:hypothetical protein BDE02_18G126400 [Populus trichocarpa]